MKTTITRKYVTVLTSKTIAELHDQKVTVECEEASLLSSSYILQDVKRIKDMITHEFKQYTKLINKYEKDDQSYHNDASIEIYLTTGNQYSNNLITHFRYSVFFRDTITAYVKHYTSAEQYEVRYIMSLKDLLTCIDNAIDRFLVDKIKCTD